jgi:gamma-glutamyltranspeptidase/glutathione hydrolase
MTLADLRAYRAKWRTPLRGSYRGAGVIAMPPPTSGGIAVVEMLNLLEGFDLRAMGPSSADQLHVLAEAQKLAWADRNLVADPDEEQVPTGVLTSKTYAASRRGEISLAHAGAYAPWSPPTALPVARSASARDANPQASTTQVSIVDARGDAVSLTCTIEQEFGSAVVAPSTGFLLNNELTDFSAPGTPNEPFPLKRPRSSMSPTIVERDSRPVLVTGGAGGARIIEGTLLSIVNVLDNGMDLAHAVDAERLDDTTGTMTLEDARVAPSVIADLRARGHTIKAVGEYDDRPRVQLAGVDPATGNVQAVTDPRSDDGSLVQRPGGEGTGLPR